MGFQKIRPEELGNAMERIGKQYMLITVKDKENSRVNAMTASWGAMGVLWNRSVCIIFVRPQRHTCKLLSEQSELSVAFLPEEYRRAHAILGRESGRDSDKLARCDLDTVSLDGVPVIAQAETVPTLKKLYEDDLREDCFLDRSLIANYLSGDYHRFYVCEIKEAYKKGE